MIQNKYPTVNWTAGMKISRRHFIETEDHFTDSIRDNAAVFLNNYNYGLLPSDKGDGTANEFVLTDKATNEVEIRLKRCNAITPGGFRISYENSSEELVFSGSFGARDLTQTNAHDQESFYVMLTINPFERVPFGTPDAEEIPPRHPYSMPRLDLQIVPAASVNLLQLGAHYLVFGKINKQGSRFITDEHFIPPCTSIRSHARLISYYDTIGGLLNEMQQNSFRIVQKVASRTQPSDLAVNVRSFCQALLHYISSVYFSFRNISHQQSPVFLLELLSSLSNIMYTTINTFPEKSKEELLKYFYEWCDLQPSAFESILTTNMEIKYNHLNVGQHMEDALKFLNALNIICIRMNSLEYIGQRKENIVVKEEVVSQSRERKGWSILD